MAAKLRFRDAFKSRVPRWLADRPTINKTVGYRFLWTMISSLDAGMDVLVQGLKASWPGQGTSTALPMIARSRGLLRGDGETDESFAARLLQWLDRWREAASGEELARQIREYLPNHPDVIVITRGHDPLDPTNSLWLTLNGSGVTRRMAPWNWDVVSHPERTGFWSEVWIVIKTTPWVVNPGTLGSGTLGSYNTVLGHQATLQEVDAVRSLIATWKSAHTRVRAVIWTSDSSLFDPDTPASLPDGEWGGWGGVGSGSRTFSNRNYTTCRYWEPA